MILHYFTNRKVLSRYFSVLLNVEPAHEESRIIERGSINRFKRRFAKRRDEDLATIVNNEKLLPEAKKQH